MKKFLTACVFAIATIAIATEIPSQQELDRLLQEHIAVLIQTPKEQRKDVRTPWLALCEMKAQEFTNAMMKAAQAGNDLSQETKDALVHMNMEFAAQFMIPLSQAVLENEAYFDEDELTECRELLNVYLSMVEENAA